MIATLRFKKTGEEINTSLELVIEDNCKDIEAAQTEITTICKRRELDPKEVLEASQDEQKFEAYSTALYNTAPTKRVLPVAPDAPIAIDI